VAGAYTLTDTTERGGASETVTGITTGTASSDRISVFCVICNPQPTSLTFNGISIPIGNGGGSNVIASAVGGGYVMVLGWIANPTGTTATLVCTGSTTQTLNQYCYSVTGCLPREFHMNGVIGTDTTLDEALDGVKIAYGARAGNTSLSWSGITSRDDRAALASTARVSTAADLTTSRAVATTITCTTSISVLAVSFVPTPQTISVDYLGSVTHTGGGNDVPFTIDIGAADADKHVYAAWSTYTGTNTVVVSGGDIDGDAHHYNSSSYDFGSERNGGFVGWQIPSKSGSLSGELNANEDIWNCVIHFFAVFDAEATPTAAAGLDSSTLSLAVTTSNEGIILANVVGFNAANVGGISGGFEDVTPETGVSGLMAKTGWRRSIASSITVTDSCNQGNGMALLSLAPKAVAAGGQAPRSMHQFRQRRFWTPRSDKPAIKRNPPAILDRYGRPMKRAA
jgi:hypothetical protein